MERRDEQALLGAARSDAQAFAAFYRLFERRVLGVLYASHRSGRACRGSHGRDVRSCARVRGDLTIPRGAGLTSGCSGSRATCWGRAIARAGGSPALASASVWRSWSSMIMRVRRSPGWLRTMSRRRSAFATRSAARTAPQASSPPLGAYLVVRRTSPRQQAGYGDEGLDNENDLAPTPPLTAIAYRLDGKLIRKFWRMSKMQKGG
jgi:hypothetical protein